MFGVEWWDWIYEIEKLATIEVNINNKIVTQIISQQKVTTTQITLNDNITIE